MFDLDMADFLFFASAAAYCAVACYTDLGKRLIPDWLTYGGIAFGLVLGAINCAYLGTAFTLQYALMLAVSLALGYSLFLIGVWAGGDAKLFWAFAALLGAAGRADALLPVVLFAASALLFLAATLLLNAKTILKKRKECERIAIETAGNAAGGASVAALFAGGIAGDLTLVLAVAAVFLLVRLPKYSWAAVLLVALAVNADATVVAFPAAFAFAFILGTVARICVEVIAPSQSYKVRARDLEEGMLPAYTVIEKAGKAVLFKPRLDFGKMLKVAGNGEAGVQEILQKSGLLPPAGSKIIADSSDAGGLGASQLQRLKKPGFVRWLQVRRTQAFAPILCACFLAALAGLL
ncbi:MAG: A24 family peptidase [Candidatus Micrarchaeia archaeon]